MPISQDHDVIEILVNDDETVQVKRKTLMLSPVFRDAFGIQSIGEEREALKDQQIKIDASAKGVRRLFGLLEGDMLEALGIATDYSKKPTIADPRPIHEARALADRYDITFFDGILVQAMLKLARLGAQPAATALGIGYAIHDQALCEFAVSHMFPRKESPQAFGQDLTNAIGPTALGALAIAYLKCESFCPCHHHTYHTGCSSKPAWTGTREQWAELARRMELSKV